MAVAAPAPGALDVLQRSLAGRRSLIVCPQIRNVGSCFLCLRKCRAQGRCLRDRKSQAQGKGYTGPPFPQAPLPRVPTCCQPGLGGQAGDLCPASHLTGSGSLRPGQGPQGSPPFPDGAWPEPWGSTLVSGVPRSLPDKRVTQQMPGRRPSSLDPSGGRCADVGPQAAACGWPAAPPPPGSSASLIPRLMRPVPSTSVRGGGSPVPHAGRTVGPLHRTKGRLFAASASSRLKDIFVIFDQLMS